MKRALIVVVVAALCGVFWGCEETPQNPGSYFKVPDEIVNFLEKPYIVIDGLSPGQRISTRETAWADCYARKAGDCHFVSFAAAVWGGSGGGAKMFEKVEGNASQLHIAMPVNGAVLGPGTYELAANLRWKRTKISKEERVAKSVHFEVYEAPEPRKEEKEDVPDNEEDEC